MEAIQEDITTITPSDDDGISVRFGVSYIVWLGFLCVLSLGVIFGNLVVMVTYWRERNIHMNPTNIFIVHLSFVDFMVGVWNIPILIINEANGGWPFGETVCKLVTALGYLFTFMSIPIIVGIVFFRLCLTRCPFHLRNRIKRRHVSISLVAAWVIFFFFYVYLAFGWPAAAGYNYVDYSNVCHLEYLLNGPMTIFIVCFEFFIPATIIVTSSTILCFCIRRLSNSVASANEHIVNGSTPDQRFGLRVNDAAGRGQVNHPISMKHFIVPVQVTYQNNPSGNLENPSFPEAQRTGSDKSSKINRNDNSGYHNYPTSSGSRTIDSDRIQHKIEKLRPDLRQSKGASTRNIHTREAFQAKQVSLNYDINDVAHAFAASDFRNCGNASPSRDSDDSSDVEHEPSCDVGNGGLVVNNPGSSPGNKSIEDASQMKQIHPSDGINAARSQNLEGSPGNNRAWDQRLKTKQSCPKHDANAAAGIHGLVPVVAAIAAGNPRDPEAQGRRDRQEALLRHRRSALMLLTVVVVFLVCWLPFQIVSLLQGLCPHCVSVSIIHTTAGIIFLNSLLNPFLYAATNAHFRRGFVRLLRLPQTWAR